MFTLGSQIAFGERIRLKPRSEGRRDTFRNRKFSTACPLSVRESPDKTAKTRTSPDTIIAFLSGPSVRVSRARLASYYIFHPGNSIVVFENIICNNITILRRRLESVRRPRERARGHVTLTNRRAETPPPPPTIAIIIIIIVIVTVIHQNGPCRCVQYTVTAV